MSQALLEERSGLRHRERARARAGLWLRAQVFLSRLGLDRALARGADPLSSPKLALRAEQLQRPKVRERIAKAIERLVEASFDDRRQHIGPAMLPFRHQRVRPNMELFGELAGALRSAGPHSVKGLAMASTLLEDGRGPLSASDPAGKVGEALNATISELAAENG